MGEAHRQAAIVYLARLDLLEARARGTLPDWKVPPEQWAMMEAGMFNTLDLVYDLADETANLMGIG